MLSTEEFMLSNCGGGKGSWESLIKPVISKGNQENPDYSLEELMLKIQYFGHLMWRATHWKKAWCWEKLKAGGEGDDKEWDGWMASLTRWTWVWANSERWWWTREAWCAVVHGVTKSRAQLSDWTGLNWCIENILWTSTLSRKKKSVKYLVEKLYCFLKG